MFKQVVNRVITVGERASIKKTCVCVSGYQSLQCRWRRGTVCLSHKRERDQKVRSTSWTFNQTGTAWLQSSGQLELWGLMGWECVRVRRALLISFTAKYRTYLLLMARLFGCTVSFRTVKARELFSTPQTSISPQTISSTGWKQKFQQFLRNPTRHGSKTQHESILQQ